MSYFVFAGGGTGGHLFPALAVVDKLRVGDKADVAFFCTQKKIDADILGKAGVKAMPLSVRPFPARPWHMPGFYLHWRRSVAVCVAHFEACRPMAVVGAGGYASGPPVHAALRLGIPTFLLNPDAVPGRANKHMAAKHGTTGILAQWEVTREHLPPDVPVIVTGCPVRTGFLAALASTPVQSLQSFPSQGGAGEGMKNESLADLFGLDASRRILLVTGASQGARTINDAMIRLAPLVGSAGWQVLHLAGAADADLVRQAYAATETHAAVLTFTDRMAEAMLLSDLIISRAGASSLAEILAVGRPSILFPYPFHRDQHQRHNGQVLVDAGAAIMLDDAKDGAVNARSLEPILSSLLRDDARREAMSRAALALGRPGAADQVAAILRNCEISTTVSTGVGSSTSIVRAA